MICVFICGPFTGPTAWDIECNVRAAEELGLAVAHGGMMPVIPHSNTRFFHGQCSGQFWYDATLELMARCCLSMGGNAAKAHRTKSEMLGIEGYLCLIPLDG